MANAPQTPDTPVSEDRRAALRAIGKYTTLGAGASLVVLSSAQAVKAAPGSNACTNSSGNASGCS